MAILKAYFDDSRDSENRAMTFAGYLSTVELWKQFDRAWKAVLDEFHVPYLHMKEFGDRDGIYKHVKESPDVEAAFMRSLIGVISDCTRFGTQITVLLDDLERFNKDHGLELDPYALAVYGCISVFQWTFPREEIQIIFDKFERAHSVIEKGMDYAESDTARPLNRSLIAAMPLQKDESWRTILPLQASDFLAWEMRKLLIDRLPWITGNDLLNFSPGQAIQSYNKWWAEFTKEHGKPPRERKSFIALRDAKRPLGHVYNYGNLMLLKGIHPHGWEITNTGGLVIFPEASGQA